MKKEIKTTTQVDVDLKDKAREIIKANIQKIPDTHIDKQAILPILEEVLKLFN